MVAQRARTALDVGEGGVFDDAEISVLRQLLQLEDDLAVTYRDAVIRPGRSVLLNLFERQIVGDKKLFKQTFGFGFHEDTPQCRLALILNEHQATGHGACQSNNLKSARARLTGKQEI